MSVMNIKYLYLLLFTININVYADPDNNPCSGSSALLNIVNRPTVADSACIVPFGKGVFEAGYQATQSKLPTGFIKNFPGASFRVGVSGNSEVVIVLPTYINPSRVPYHGFTTTTVGIKHEIASNTTWVISAEALFTPPSGSESFGNNGLGTAVNGIIAYNFTPSFSFSFMFGATSATQSILAGGQRFSSFNPDLVLTYSVTPKLNLFGEIYGQSKTSPTNDRGLNADGGFLYLIQPNMVLDIEYGQYISGNLGDFKNYVGAGFSAIF